MASELSDFIKRSMEKENGLNTGNYWIDNIADLPLDGLLENRDEAYLKNVLKDDENIHRRTFALGILWNIMDTEHDSFAEYFAKLVVELDMSMNDFEKIIKDYTDFSKAMDVIKEVSE
jgi:hypothetical protein